MTATCCWCEAPLIEANGAWWCGSTVTDACRKRQGKFMMSVTHKTTGQLQVLYVPTPKQTVWHEAVYRPDLTRICVGGAAGPGKSKWLRETLKRLAMTIPGFHGLLLRRTFKDLEQSHLRFLPHETAQVGGTYKVSERIATFSHGKGQPVSVIRAGHMETDGDVQNFLSSEYDVVAPDELVTFDRDPMLELFTRARTTNKKMLEIGGAKVLAPTNPGGRGALWVKDFFIDKNPDPSEFPKYRPEHWAFFDARLTDNPYMDPAYRETLEQLPEMRRRQLLEGDWTAYEGQFFSEWRPVKNDQPYHVQRLEIDPATLEWSAALDWGFNAPFSFGIYAHLPDGKSYRRREWKASGVTAEEFRARAWQIVKEEGIPEKALRYVVADPSIKNKTGAGRGESVLETLTRGRNRLPMRAGDNDRVNGWYRVHEMLRPAPDGTPWLIVDPSCTYAIRTIPAMVQDKNDPDDMDTSKDDHACDEIRYHCMSRPRPGVFSEQPKPFPVGSWGWMTAQHKKPYQGVLA